MTSEIIILRFVAGDGSVIECIDYRKKGLEKCHC